MQVGCRIFDVKVLGLSRPALRGYHSTTVDILEVSVRKLIVAFGAFVLLIVDSQVP